VVERCDISSLPVFYAPISMSRLIASIFYFICIEIFAQSESLLPTTKFSIEFGYRYNGLNMKHGLQLRSHFWFLKKNSIGPEFHVYIPNKDRNYLDYQIDLNFRRISVDFHPVTFDFLIGPSYRSTRDSVNQEGEFIRPLHPNENRYFSFDGINLGFGMNYRIQNHSFFIMPRINHKNSSFQISLGYKYHFDIYLDERKKKRYNLRTRPKKN